MMSLAVAIVSYNTRAHLDACLASVQPEAPPQTVVVDNGSTDGSIELVRSHHPWVELEVAATNRGYGAAANRAIARSTARYVLLLNSDTLLRPGALQALAGYLDDHPRAALVGPRLQNLDGSLQPSCAPFLGTFQSFLEKAALARALARIPVLRDRYLLVHSPHDRPRVVPWVLGAALAIRREAFEAVGGFDEAFFMYGEEVDLSYRLKAAGWEVHFAPVTDVVHVGGASTAPRRTDMEVRRVASALMFYRRHYSAPRAAALGWAIRAAGVGRWLRDAVRLRITADPGRSAALATDIALWRRLSRLDLPAPSTVECGLQDGGA